MEYAGTTVTAEAVELREVLLVLRRQAWLIVAVALTVAALTAAVVLRRPPEYRASAMLRLKDERGALTAGLTDGGLESVLMGRTSDPLLSELEILKSPAIADAVVAREGLRLKVPYDVVPSGLIRDVRVDSTFPADTLQIAFADDRVTVRGRGSSAAARYGEPLRLQGLELTVAGRPEVTEAEFEVLSQTRAIQEFLESLEATPREKTDVVDVAFTAADPELAQRVVNSTVREFQVLNTKMAQQQSQRRRIFVEEQLVKTDSMLADAQLAMSEFRRREQVYSSSERFAAEQRTLTGLEVRRSELDAERRMYMSLLNGVQGSGSADARDGLGALVSSPALAANPAISMLFSRLVQYQTARDSMTTGRYASSASNPDVQRLTTLIETTRTNLVLAVRSHIDAVEAQLKAMDELRSNSAVEIASLPASEAEEVRLMLQLETVKKIADQLRDEYQRARVEEVVEAGQVELLATAALPEEPVPSHRPLKVALGLMMGLLLGCGGAFIRENLNTSLGRKEEIEKVLRVPALAVVPHIVSKNGNSRLGPGRSRLLGGNGRAALQRANSETGLVTVTQHNSSGAEAYRTLRTNLIFSQVVHTLRTIVVTSSSPGEGKTTTACNLAAAFAQQGMRVLLVDCDLRRPRVHNVFGVPQEPGLSQVVLGKGAASAAIRATAVQGLHVLAAGNLVPNPAELLGSERMRTVLREFALDFDTVILDTAPLTAASDAAVLGARADGVLMVVRAGHTERSAALHSMEQLATVGARVVGAVLNDPDSKLQQYGGYYGYHDYYSDQPAEVG